MLLYPCRCQAHLLKKVSSDTIIMWGDTLVFKLSKMKLFRASQSSVVHVEAVLTSNQSPVEPGKIFQTFINTVVCKPSLSQSFIHQSTSCAKIHIKAALCSTGADPNPDLRMYMYLEEDEASNICRREGIQRASSCGRGRGRRKRSRACSRTLSNAAFESEIHSSAPQRVIFLKGLSNNPDYLVIIGSLGLLFCFHNFPLCLLHAYLKGERCPLAGRVCLDRSTRKELRKHHYFPWQRVLPALGSDHYGAG